jgi:hypothetical protein
LCHGVLAREPHETPRPVLTLANYRDLTIW